VVGGKHYQEQEEDHPITDNWYFDCGCRSITHEFADGSLQVKVIHHNGTLLLDELVGEHGP
jgi:hypothetical protein